jgi:predicted  nucleic acid-binding Zn-ribbon protein
MKVPHAHQEIMLQVAGLDLELETLKSRLVELQTGAHLDSLRTSLFAASSRMLEQQTKLENFQQELHKLETDIELVDKRIELDRQRLSSTSSSKDAEGISSELRSLATRKSSLEDQELEIMENVETITALVELESATRTGLSNELSDSEAAMAGEITKLASQISIVATDRSAKFAILAEEAATLFTKKASRGIPVAALKGRDCDACRIGLTSSAYEDVVATPADEIATCPNCQAILIR